MSIRQIDMRVLTSVLPSHIHFHCIILNHFIHLLYGILKYTVNMTIHCMAMLTCSV